MQNVENCSAINRSCLTITPDKSITEAIRLMSQTHSSCVLVLDGNQCNSRVIGLFTERDVVRLASLGTDLSNVSVADVMTRSLITITEAEAQDIFFVLKIFRQHGIRHLPVVGEAGNLVGIITHESICNTIKSADLLKHNPVSEVMSCSVIHAPRTTSILELSQMIMCHNLFGLQEIFAEQTAEFKQLNQELRKKINRCKLIEDRLRSSEAKMRATFEAMTDIVLIINIQDSDIGSIELLPTNSSCLDTARIDLTNLMVEQFFQQNTNQRWLRQIRQALDTQETLYFDYSLSLEGQEVWFSANISPILEDSALWVARDITQSKQAVIALRESEQRFYEAFEYAAIGMALFALNGCWLKVNRSLCQIVGYSEQELLATNFQSITHPDDLMTDLCYAQQLLAGELNAYHMEKRYLHKQGNIVWILLSVSLVRNEQGQPLYFIAQIQDISDKKYAQNARKLAEAALRESEAREREKAQKLELTLKDLQRTQAQLVLHEKMAGLGQLVAGIAHEINNPTTFIYGNIKPACEYTQNLLQLIKLYRQNYSQPIPEIAEQLESKDIDFIIKDFPKLLASIEEGANRITEIVRSLQNFSRGDRGEQKSVDIHQGIDSTLLILQHRLKQQSRRPEIQVIKEYGELPFVSCYPGQLNQVFMNLLSNAIDAIEESLVKSHWSKVKNQGLIILDKGHLTHPLIHIRTRIIESRIVISITDNGSGIKTEIQPKIFDPFFTTKSPGKGTGLGLSISYKIVVEGHGGQLYCHSVAGEGTEFLIELPITNK